MTLKDPSDLEKVTGAPNIGIVPTDKNVEKKRPFTSVASMEGISAESFRELRTQLHFVQVDNPPKTLVVTSAVPSEGKSFTVINLAAALASAGNTVVVVDLDLHKPVLAKRFDLINEVGFSTVIAGDIPLQDALQKTSIPRVTLLAAGSKAQNSAALLGSHKAKALLAALKAEFDWVIIDTPPLLSVIDAAEAAMNADGALVVARYGSTRKPDFNRAVKKLTSINANIIGTALTMTPEDDFGSYYYYYYHDDSSRPGSRGRHFQERGSAGPETATLLSERTV